MASFRKEYKNIIINIVEQPGEYRIRFKARDSRIQLKRW